MSTLPATIDQDDLGPKMLALTEMQQRFVLAYVLGAGTQTQQQCAIEAGYSPDTARIKASQLLRHTGVLEAVHECALQRLQSGALIGINVIIDIAMNYQHKDQLKAAKLLAEGNRIITPADQVIEVKHTVSDQERIKNIEAMAVRLGLDPRQLLGQSAPIDTEFTVVPEDDDLWTVYPEEVANGA